MITAAYAQSFYRFRNDDGSETTATWIDAENTDIALTDTTTTFRLRVAIEETAGGAANNVSASIQYNLNAAGYTDVGAQGGAEAINLAASTNVADAEATTDQISGAGTFTEGEIAEATNDAVASFAGNDHTEHEWVLELNSAQVAPGDTIDFRVLQNDATITYTATPTVTVETAGEATVTTDAASGVGETQATLNGTLTLSGFADADVWFEWREVGAATWTSTPTQTLTASGSFSEALTTLTADTAYEYRAQALASDGTTTSTGSTVTFDTKPTAPAAPTNLTADFV